MKRAALLCAMLLTPTLALGAQWKIRIDEIRVRPNKANNKPWDGLGDPPDLQLSFKVGAREKGRCVPRGEILTEKAQDTLLYKVGVEGALNLEAGQDPCFIAKLWDRDALADDLIGIEEGALSLGAGQKIDLGQGQILLDVIDIEAKRAALEGPAPSRDIGVSPRSGLVKLTFTSAELSPTRPDGTPWDEAHDQRAEDKETLALLAKAGLALYFVGPAALPLVRRGDRAVYESVKASAPDPRMRVDIGDLIVETSIQPNTFAPAWNLVVVVDPAKLPNGLLKLEVFDGDGEARDPIGAELVPLASLLKGPNASLSFGAVRRLLVVAERVDEAPKAITHEVVLSPQTRWAPIGWVTHAGQTIVVEGWGAICFEGRCFDPEGDEGAVLRGGEHPLRRGQLAVALGGRVQAIGASHTFRAWTSGPAFVGIVGEAPGSGGFSVRAHEAFPLQPAATTP